MRATCVFAVASLITSFSQISGFERPRASRSSTSSLARRQVGERRRQHGRRDRPPPRELVDHRARDGRREERIAARDDANGCHDFLRRRILQHETTRACVERVIDVAVEPERGQDQHPRTRLRADDPARGLDPVEHRHADVHEHNVRLQPACLGDGVLAVGGLTDDGRLAVALENLA